MKESPLLTNNSQANLGLAKLNTCENTTTHVDPENGPPRVLLALPVLECIDFVSDVGGVDQAPQYVV
ncbi:hypothetical protein QP983_12380, partial [Corynebacterium striatum]|nr:hypothetical protein [Corynebacterium striatum]